MGKQLLFFVCAVALGTNFAICADSQTSRNLIGQNWYCTDNYQGIHRYIFNPNGTFSEAFLHADAKGTQILESGSYGILAIPLCLLRRSKFWTARLIRPSLRYRPFLRSNSGLLRGTASTHAAIHLLPKTLLRMPLRSRRSARLRSGSSTANGSRETDCNRSSSFQMGLA